MKKNINRPENGKSDSQFKLLGKKRFAPFFFTQFLGAFNDNLFKNALMIFIAYLAGQAIKSETNFLINLSAGLFILPFFLFSALAGQLADKFEKSKLIQIVKLSEVAIMIGAGIAFYYKSLGSLLAMLFLMGTQSSFFGPVKYSLLPQHLKPQEIVAGNALVEMGTFIAILVGTMAGAEIVRLPTGNLWTGIMIVMIALAGFGVSRGIPEGKASAPGLKINWNPISQTWQTIKLARTNRPVFLSILAISWFWFVGVIYLTQLPSYSRDVLHCNERVVTLLLAMFSLGVGMGSLICDRLSGGKVELGLVPIGSFGLTIFGIDLFFAYNGQVPLPLMGIKSFIQTAGSYRVLTDFFLIGLFGGIFTVPLFAFIQTKTEPRYRARIIAANNIMNALFMVIASLFSILLMSVFDFNTLRLFLTIAVGNAPALIFIISKVPEFLARFLVWGITHTLYRVAHEGLEQIPDEGAAVIVSNHVSFVDALLIAGACRRPIRFVMYAPIYRFPLLNWFFRIVKTIPIDSKRKDPRIYAEAFKKIDSALKNGELVCIFPEGKLTKDGELDQFKPGIEKIIKKTPVPVIPLALKGLWGSFFSYKGGKAMARWPRRFWAKVGLSAECAIAPQNVSADRLWHVVRRLRGNLL